MNSILLAAAVPLFFFQSCIAFSTEAPTIIVPEVHATRLTQVSQLVSSALGDKTDDNGDDRYASARLAVNDFQVADNSIKGGDNADAVVPSHELVYGELSVPVLATILDAVGVQENDVFLDIGSGDGALVLGASLLYGSSCYDENEETNAIRKCYGADIVPGLVDRSITHAKNLERILQEEDNVSQLEQFGQNQSEIQFLLGDIHQPDDELVNVLKETTLAVCFATTWSAGNAHNNDDNDTTGQRKSTSLQGRKLPKLSKALSAGLSSGCRVVIIDGKLDTADDGFSWQGDLRIQCPDTAPYSVATLYQKH